MKFESQQFSFSFHSLRNVIILGLKQRSSGSTSLRGTFASFFHLKV